MVQVPKDHVREAFVAAAATAFAELGYAATTMAAVAERAGSSVGNLYKYFSSKQQLFDAAVPAELVRELTRRTRARMRALGSAKDVRDLPPNAAYHALSGELLDYCLQHRQSVIVLLARAEGTAFAGFAPDFVESLVDWSLEYARGPYPELCVSAELRFVLGHAYRSFVHAVADALKSYADDAQARAVIALLTTHHQGGLKRLFESQGETDAESRHPSSPAVVSKPARPRARDAGASSPSAGAPAAAARKADRPRRSGRRR